MSSKQIIYDFLATVLPKAPYYCVSIKDPNIPHSLRNTPINSLEKLVSKALSASEAGNNAYFALSGYGQEKIIVQNPDGTLKKQFRTQNNAIAQKALWLDVDAGKLNSKYRDADEARKALDDFIKDTGLPPPTIVSSGHGLHVYWSFTEQIDTTHWQRIAAQLKQLIKQMDFDVDHSRTTDAASLLRVPGTKNYGKDTIPPDVVVLQLSPPSSAEELEALLSKASTQNISNDMNLMTPDPLMAAMAALHPYARQALEGECANVARAQEGERNNSLNKASFSLGTLIGGGAIDEWLARSMLLDAALKCGLPYDETTRTIESGITSGIQHPRSIPDNTTASSQASEESIASAFTARHAETLRFCTNWGCWFEWNPCKHIWEQDKTNKVFDYARQECKNLNPKNKPSLGKSATAKGVESFARADPRHATTHDLWDRDPFMLGTPSGVISLNV